MKYTLIACALLALTSCSMSRLEIALRLAKDNKEELERVLEHYENDGQKLAAAEFLIENMPYHFSYVDARLDSMKRVQTQIRTQGYINDQDLERWSKHNYRTFNKIYDIHVITADYLIENIDLAFEQWQTLPWNKNLPFDDFCELLLPYRIGDEPLERWRKEYYNSFKHLADSLENPNDMLALASHLSEALYTNKFRYNEQINLPHQGASHLLKYSLGVCTDACDLSIYTLRAFGIPCGIDHYVFAPDYREGHEWSFVRDTSGAIIPFWMDDMAIHRGKKVDRKTGKIFRTNYGQQPELYDGIEEDEGVPALFRNRRIRDVSEQYYGQNSISVELREQSSNYKYAYLGVFSSEGYHPIAIAPVKDGRATFFALESGVIYQPLYIEGNNQQLAAYPFEYAGMGTASYFTPDTLNTESATLTRKYRLREMMSSFMHESVGATIEFSGNADFSGAVEVCKIPDTIPTNRIVLTPQNGGRCYRYMRITAPAEQHLTIAELQIYANGGELVDYTPAKRNDARYSHHIVKINDGDILSYYQSLRREGEAVEVEFTQSVSVDSIVYIPRNDDNFVWPGDRYELLYNNGGGYVSLGSKVASGYSLTFDGIPSGALLWLRNLSKGREEQVFYLEDGVQCFPQSMH